MSREQRAALLACGLCLGIAAMAEELEPEEEFLEYLGMWEETDEDWLLLNEFEVVENAERSDPVPEGEESAEKQNES